MFQNIQNSKVIDVTGGKDAEGQAVIVHGKHGKANQKWNVLYVDKAKPVPTKGFSEEFGFHINRPFYMVSRLPMKRVAECIGASDVRLRRYISGRKEQQFWFNNVSKTVHSNHWKNYIMEIPGNGAQNSLRMTSTISSRWW
jgi:hypothetical protein